MAGEGQGEDEYQVVRLDCYNPPLNIINSYGEQEKVGKEEQEERWGRLRKEMEGIRERGELCVLVNRLETRINILGLTAWGFRGTWPGCQQEGGWSGTSWPRGTGGW